MAISKKQLLGLGSALLIIIVAIVVAVGMATSPSNLTEEQINQKFNCNRATADYRATDVYCSNPGLYNEHVKNNTVITTP